MNEEYFAHCGFNWTATIDRIERSDLWAISTVAILLPVIPISLISNTLLIIVLIRTGHIKKRSCFLATNLAFIDLFCTIFIGFSELYYVAKNNHFLGMIGCKITASAYTLYFSGTTLLMVFSSFERYYHAMLLNEPLKNWKMKLLVLFVYSYIIGLISLTIIGTEFDNGVCMYEIYFFGLVTEITKLFHIITGFAIPGIILGIVFYKIYKFLQADALKYRVQEQPRTVQTTTQKLSRPNTQACSNQVKAPQTEGLRRNTNSMNSSGALATRNRIFYILALSVASFYICELLYVIFGLWKLIAELTFSCIYPVDNQFVQTLSILAYPVLIVNCAINPNIYLILSRRFRSEIKSMALFVVEKFRNRDFGSNSRNGHIFSAAGQTQLTTTRQNSSSNLRPTNNRNEFYRQVGGTRRNNVNKNLVVNYRVSKV